MMKYFLLFVCLFSGNLSYKTVFADDVNDLISRSEAEGAKGTNDASELIDDSKKYAFQQQDPYGKRVDSSNNQQSKLFRKKPDTARSTTMRPEASTYRPDDTFQKILPQKALKNVPLVHEGRKGCKDKGSQTSAKCASSLFEKHEQKESVGTYSNTQLLIFVSETVPANSIKELWSQAQKVGGKLIIRGLVGTSFKATQKYIQDLGVIADIDPTRFEEFEIVQVPAFILSKENKYDKMVGNVSLLEFLERACDNGELKVEAKIIYTQLEGGHS